MGEKEVTSKFVLPLPTPWIQEQAKPLAFDTSELLPNNMV